MVQEGEIKMLFETDKQTNKQANEQIQLKYSKFLKEMLLE